MFDIRLKCGTLLSLTDLEDAGLSYVPCGQVDGKDQPLLSYAHLWGQRRRVRKTSYGKRWNSYTTPGMNGVQIMTGMPTYKRHSRTGYLHYTSIDIESRMLQLFPETVAEIRKLYEDRVIGTPCIIKTKSDGLRLDAYTEYVGKKMSFKDAEQKMLFEILADKCLARIDARYEMVSGSVLDIPTLPKKALQEIYHLVKSVATHEQSDSKPREVVETSQIGDLDVEWGSDGRSQLFSTAHCQRSSHSSNREEVRFTKYRDGSVDGKCFNCGESWWEVPPAKPTKPKRKAPPQIQPITTLPPDYPIIASAPTFEPREKPSYPHFTAEARIVVRDVLGISPDAGWHGQTPVFTTRYEYLHPLTNKFALNGQPSEVETRRVWSTLFGNCEICGDVTANWIDRYLLTAGFYCDGCHKDYPIGSYLEWELDRKLPNSIVSEYQGFLGDDPEFQDFRLWEPGMLTHLGAGMATGKSTEIYKEMTALAVQGLGKGIIAVPRISLARFLAHLLRRRDGFNSWGLWHEGVSRSDRFIGEYGAIVCVPSLPRAVQYAENNGVTQLHIAIDELDFSYGLLSLSIEQTTAVKKCLRDALDTTGLVVSGQTESTLSLEAFAEEIGAEQIQGFYNTAEPADGSVVMHKHANTDGKSMSIVCGAMDDISELFDEEHNVYVFCSSRRDGDLMAHEFRDENPVVYNAHTKGTARADAVLRNQRLTDSRLFIGTSAAGVGISILDPKAWTVIASGLNYGSRDAGMAVQKCVRDRGRCGISFHYADYNLSLPVKPTENEIVSLYHEAVKEAASESAHLPSAGIRKIAYAQALNTLADSQYETFVEYHLGKIGNMPVYHASALPHDTERIEAVSERRSEIRREEKQKRITTAIRLLKQQYLLTTSEIRKMSNNGRLSPDDRLAHETANAAAQAVGWNDEVIAFSEGEPIKEMPNSEDIQVAAELVENNISIEKLLKQRRGYLAVNFPKWTAHQFQTDLESSDTQLVNDGNGLEITAINDDRFLGQLLMKLLDRLTGKVFDSASLATAVREVLNSPAETGKTFGSEISAGALGASAYRKARFLHCADDDFLISWIQGFVSRWYPARIGKNDDDYALCHAEHIDLRLAAFSRWLLKQPGVPDGSELNLPVIEATELPDHDADLKKNARFRREAGETITSIAEALNRNPRTIRKWCEGIKPPSPAQSEILGILADGAVWKRSDIEARTRFAHQNITSAFNALLEAGKICKPKRGYYQQK